MHTGALEELPAAAARSMALATLEGSLQMATIGSHSTPMPSHAIDRNTDTCSTPEQGGLRIPA